MVLRWFVMHDTIVSVPSLKYTDCSVLNKNYFLKCLPLCAKSFKPPFFFFPLPLFIRPNLTQNFHSLDSSQWLGPLLLKCLHSATSFHSDTPPLRPESLGLGENSLELQIRICLTASQSSTHLHSLLCPTICSPPAPWKGPPRTPPPL